MVTEEQYVVTGNVDRRAHLRYRFVTSLEYKLIGSKGIERTGRGRTVNVSNSGLLVESEAAMSPGVKIELSIKLPLLEGKDVPASANHRMDCPYAGQLRRSPV
jgi:hypothetical protein